MNTLIVGMGEIGTSLYSILSKTFLCWGIDIKKGLNRNYKNKPIPKNIDVIHICIRYSDKFIDIVNNYLNKYCTHLINICSTVPPGTTEKISPYACHSTTRGLHPNLSKGLLNIKKHIGGRNAKELEEYFIHANIPCEIHESSKTTELLHILNNAHYGINLMFANEAAKLCREYGVDYYDYMKYTETNNDGYMALGHKTKVRPILTPPGNKIGGHCVVQSAQLIPKELRPDLINKLSEYNDL